MWVVAALGGGVLAINCAAFVIFWWDKQCAIAGRRRVQEALLLALAASGGWPGAKLGQRWFRHKTRKQPFGTLLNLIPALWLAGAIFVVWSAQG